MQLVWEAVEREREQILFITFFEHQGLHCYTIFCYIFDTFIKPRMHRHAFSSCLQKFCNFAQIKLEENSLHPYLE